MVMMSRDSMMIMRAGTCEEGRASAASHAAPCQSCRERAAPGCGCCGRFPWPRRRLCGQQRHRPSRHLALRADPDNRPSPGALGSAGGGEPRQSALNCAQRAPHLVKDADDDGVEEADAGHAHQAEQEQVGLAVELKVGGLWVQDGAHQLPFRSAEPCSREDPQKAGQKGGPPLRHSLVPKLPRGPGGCRAPRAAPSGGGKRVLRKALPKERI